MRLSPGHQISERTSESDEIRSAPVGTTDEWVEVTEVQGGQAQVLTLWKLEDTSEGPQARRVWRGMRLKGVHGPLLLVA